jgi:hypothetical protein
MNTVSRVVLTLAIALALAGCEETPTETREDVSRAQADRSEAVGEARDESRQVAADTTEDTAEARHGLAMARAEGNLEVDKQRCDAQTGQDEVACNAAATAAYEAAKANADADLAAAERMAEAIED